MKDQESTDNWQLEEDSQVDDRWVLRESEQQLSDQWQLSQSEEDEPIQDWQPVEYNRTEQSNVSWILPILVTVFLLALIGYSGFILLPPLFQSPTPDPAAMVADDPTPDTAQGIIGDDGEEGEEAPVAEDPPADTEPVEPPPPDEPEPTPEPVVTPTIETELPPIVNQEFATVISTYGVNARSSPSADGDIVRILEQGESFFLFGAPTEGWLELLVTEEGTELVQGEPIQGEVAYASSEFFDVATQPTVRELYEEVMLFAGREPEGLVADADEDEEIVGLAPTPTPGVTDDDTDDTDDTDDEVTVVPAEPQEVTVTVVSEAGLNMRSQPDATGDIVTVLNSGDTATALAVSDDESWIQIQLDDGTSGWVFAEFVSVSGDLSQIGAAPPSPATAPIVIDATEVVTSGIVPPAPFSSIIPGDTPAVVVAVEVGARARVAPDATATEIFLLPQGAALPALRLSADDQWIEVELPEGNLNGWVARSVVSVTSDIDTLPVEGDETPAAAPDDEPDAPILLPTPTPQPAASNIGTGTGTNTGTETDATSPAALPASATVRDILLDIFPEPNAQGNSLGSVSRSTVLDVNGRNSESDWIQVESAEISGWVPVRSVILTVGADTLPIVEP